MLGNTLVINEICENKMLYSETKADSSSRVNNLELNESNWHKTSMSRTDSNCLRNLSLVQQRRIKMHCLRYTSACYFYFPRYFSDYNEILVFECSFIYNLIFLFVFLFFNRFMNLTLSYSFLNQGPNFSCLFSLILIFHIPLFFSFEIRTIFIESLFFSEFRID